MDRSDFTESYAEIYEHSPWVPERVGSFLGPDGLKVLFSDGNVDVGQLARLMADCVDNAAPQKQLELIRAHPDLAGKARRAGELTAASTHEQASAGLDQCSAAQFQQLTQFNVAYKEKFQFPFIMAVRDSNRAEILAAFGDRLDNDYDAEFETALQEIHKIARLRLDAMEHET